MDLVVCNASDIDMQTKRQEASSIVLGEKIVSQLATSQAAVLRLNRSLIWRRDLVATATRKTH